MIFPSEGSCDIEASHTAEFLLLLEEEELVGLHKELPADLVVVIDDDIGYIVLLEDFPGCKTGRPGADDGNLAAIDIGPGIDIGGNEGRMVVIGKLADLLHPIHLGDTYPPHLSVDQHLACTALSNTAFQAAFTFAQAMAVHGKASLVKCCSYTKSLITSDLLPFKEEIVLFDGRDIEYGVFNYTVHCYFFNRKAQVYDFLELNNPSTNRIA